MESAQGNDPTRVRRGPRVERGLGTDWRTDWNTHMIPSGGQSVDPDWIGKNDGRTFLI